MALQDIIQKILQDANLEAERIALEAQNEAKEIQNEAKSKAEASKERIAQEATNKELEMERKTKTLAETEHKNLLLNAKRALLEKVFANAKNKLASMPSAKKEEIFIFLLTQISEKNGIVQVASSDVEIVKKAIKKVGKDFKISENANLQSGFIFEAKGAEVDFSFDSVVDKEVAPQVELEVAKMLFN